jgi:hypothetical protein
VTLQLGSRRRGCAPRRAADLGRVSAASTLRTPVVPARRGFFFAPTINTRPRGLASPLIMWWRRLFGNASRALAQSPHSRCDRRLCSLGMVQWMHPPANSQERATTTTSRRLAKKFRYSGYLGCGSPDSDLPCLITPQGPTGKRYRRTEVPRAE